MAIDFDDVKETVRALTLRLDSPKSNYNFVFSESDDAVEVRVEVGQSLKPYFVFIVDADRFRVLKDVELDPEGYASFTYHSYVELLSFIVEYFYPVFYKLNNGASLTELLSRVLGEKVRIWKDLLRVICKSGDVEYYDLGGSFTVLNTNFSYNPEMHVLRLSGDLSETYKCPTVMELVTTLFTILAYMFQREDLEINPILLDQTEEEDFAFDDMAETMELGDEIDSMGGEEPMGEDLSSEFEPAGDSLDNTAPDLDSGKDQILESYTPLLVAETNLDGRFIGSAKKGDDDPSQGMFNFDEDEVKDPEFEKLHPRADDGKFTDKEAPAASGSVVENEEKNSGNAEIISEEPVNAAPQEAGSVEKTTSNDKPSTEQIIKAFRYGVLQEFKNGGVKEVKRVKRYGSLRFLVIEACRKLGFDPDQDTSAEMEEEVFQALLNETYGSFDSLLDGVEVPEESTRSEGIKKEDDNSFDGVLQKAKRNSVSNNSIIAEKSKKFIREKFGSVRHCQGLEKYTQYRYRLINNFLRTGELPANVAKEMSFSDFPEGKPTAKMCKDKVASWVNDLAILTSQEVPENIVAYRSVLSGEGIDYLNADVGEVVVEKGFTSTSLSEKKGFNFAVGNSAFALYAKMKGVDNPNERFITILVPKGAKGFYVGADGGFKKDEKEFLLGAGTKFRVISKNGKYVTLEVVV